MWAHRLPLTSLFPFSSLTHSLPFLSVGEEGNHLGNLTMKIPGTNPWNSNSVSMAWESTFSKRAVGELDGYMNLPWTPVHGFCEQLAISVTNLYSARLETKSLSLSKPLWQLSTVSKQEKIKGMINYAKEVVYRFPLMYVWKHANAKGLLSGKKKFISQLWLERPLL